MVAAETLIGGARAVVRCDALGASPFTDMEGGLYRGYLTRAHLMAIDRIGSWMVEAGMRVEIDHAANLIGRYEGDDQDMPSLLIGSHIDSVRDGGRYDGPLGVMLGIECVAALNDVGRRMPFPIEVIAFGDEEGSRFPAAMLTSRAVAGTLDADLATMADGEGRSLGAALREFHADYYAMREGTAIMARCPADITGYHGARRSTGSTLAYLEAHIEQGPVLEARGLAVGTVTGIAAQLRYQIDVTGMAGHAGTSPMPLRRDALTGAAEMMLAIEAIAQENASDLVATVGKIEALPGAPNVIPGAVSFTLDIRAGDQRRRDRVAEAMLQRMAEIAGARSLGFNARHVHDLPASPCDSELMDLMDAAIAEAGQTPMRLVSGAGHDAMVMAALCPTAMLFIRCRGGISHNPAEHVEPDDAELALRVMLAFIGRLEKRYVPA